MTVTFGALQPHAQKQPSDSGGDLLDVELLQHEIRGRMPKICGRIEKGVALTRQNFADHLIVRTVLGNPIVNPFLKYAHRAALRVELTVSKPVFEFDGPERCVLGTAEQIVD